MVLIAFASAISSAEAPLPLALFAPAVAVDDAGEAELSKDGIPGTLRLILSSRASSKLGEPTRLGDMVFSLAVVAPVGAAADVFTRSW